MKKWFTFVTILVIGLKLHAQEFITRWNIPASTTSIGLYLTTTGNVNYTWETIPAGTSGSGTISGPIGIISGLPISASSVRLKLDPTYLTSVRIHTDWLFDIEQWGAVQWTSMDSAFAYCSNLNITSTDTPNLSLVTSMREMFANCSNLNSINYIELWNTVSVQNMAGMFAGCNFNQNIGAWNTSNVTDMSYMFEANPIFNSDIGAWNTGAVTNMSRMFYSVFPFNQDISGWNTSNVTDMSFMFYEDTEFNQNIGGWNVSNVETMEQMFCEATNFNQDIGNWNTSSVKNMSAMFCTNGSFNQDIGNWNTATVEYMNSMFGGASSFNHNIGNWNTAAVIDMSFMLGGASSFNHALNKWHLNPNVIMNGMFDFSGMKCINYTSTLDGWANNISTPTGRTLGAKNILFGTNAIPSRDFLINTKGWTIIGDSSFSMACGSTSTNNYNKENNIVISISPNPANKFTKVRIESDRNKQAQLEIYNYLGNKVFEDILNLHSGINDYALNTNEFANGIYIIRTQIAGNIFVNQLVLGQ